MGGPVEVKHPAKFSGPILSQIDAELAVEAERLEKDRRRLRVLDPFAGVGTIHSLGYNSTGIEIEPEWVKQHPQNEKGHALHLRFRARSFDAVATSPCHGNRFADHHNAKDASRRHGHRFALGRDPTKGSAAVMQWGKQRRDFHRDAWREVWRVLRPGGLFVLNVSNHVRQKQIIRVTEWHLETCLEIGFGLQGATLVRTSRMRHGQNGTSRVAGEMVVALRKGAAV